MSENNDAIAEKVREIIAEKLGIDKSKVVDSARFIDDLGADSLDTVDLVMAFEDQFKIEISNKEGEDIQSVEQAISFIQKKCGK